MKKPPNVLDEIVDKVLAYRPKPKSKAAKKRQRKSQKRESSIIIPLLGFIRMYV